MFLRALSAELGVRKMRDRGQFKFRGHKLSWGWGRGRICCRCWLWSWIWWWLGVADNNTSCYFANVTYSSQGYFMVHPVNPVFHWCKPRLWGVSKLALSLNGRARVQLWPPHLHLSFILCCLPTITCWHEQLHGWPWVPCTLCAVHWTGASVTELAGCVLLPKGSWCSGEDEQI